MSRPLTSTTTRTTPSWLSVGKCEEKLMTLQIVARAVVALCIQLVVGRVKMYFLCQF